MSKAEGDEYDSREAEGWLGMALDAAKDWAEENLDQIVEGVVGGDLSHDVLNDYPGGDSYFADWATGKVEGLGLVESAALVEALPKYEETDAGLWRGTPWRDVVNTVAYYTLRNAGEQGAQALLKHIKKQTAPLADEPGALDEGRVRVAVQELIDAFDGV